MIMFYQGVRWSSVYLLHFTLIKKITLNTTLYLVLILIQRCCLYGDILCHYCDSMVASYIVTKHCKSRSVMLYIAYMCMMYVCVSCGYGGGNVNIYSLKCLARYSSCMHCMSDISSNRSLSKNPAYELSEVSVVSVFDFEIHFCNFDKYLTKKKWDHVYGK